jgi:hypothetical protein
MNRYWLIKNDMVARIDSPNKESDEFKFLINNGWKLKRNEPYCTDNEMYQFLDKNGPSTMDEIKKAFPNHTEDDLRHALGVLIYTAKSVDTMNGIKGMSGVFVTARYQKNWAAKIQKQRNNNNPISMCDLPNPDVDQVSTIDKPKILDNIVIKQDDIDKISDHDIKKSTSIDLPKVVQKLLRKEIVDKSSKENLYNFDNFINSLSKEHICYWNEYLDDFKKKLILTEIKKKTQV